MKGADEITNTEDIIDSREVIERIAYLEIDEEDLSEDELSELKTLRSLATDGDNATSDWSDGATLIRDSHFEEYAQQLAEDIDAIDENAKWPLNHIDWEAAAEELQTDYTSIEFDGVTYWTR